MLPTDPKEAIETLNQSLEVVLNRTGANKLITRSATGEQVV